MNREALENLLEYIDIHIQEKISLKELAELAGYSPFYFSRLFSECMGISVTSYIRMRKMQFALADLMEGKTVLEVALKYAFDSHEGFTRSFSQLFGSTPKTAKRFLTTYKVQQYVVPTIDDRSENMDIMRAQNLQENMHQMVYEILKESISEAQEGYCTEIKIALLSDNQIKISDNGRGIPLVPNERENHEVLEKIFGGHPIIGAEYGQMGDLSQCGLRAVCSLCESFSIIVYRDGKAFRQDYIRGIAQHELYEKDSDHSSGMEITFKPDENIFGEMRFIEKELNAWLTEETNNVSGVDFYLYKE